MKVCTFWDRGYPMDYRKDYWSIMKIKKMKFEDDELIRNDFETRYFHFLWIYDKYEYFQAPLTVSHI